MTSRLIPRRIKLPQRAARVRPTRFLDRFIFHIDVKPDMRIPALHTRDHACQLDRLIDLVFRREGMVSEYGRCGDSHAQQE
jgi:hypothetical protein